MKNNELLEILEKMDCSFSFGVKDGIVDSHIIGEPKELILAVCLFMDALVDAGIDEDKLKSVLDKKFEEGRVFYYEE